MIMLYFDNAINFQLPITYGTNGMASIEFKGSPGGEGHSPSPPENVRFIFIFNSQKARLFTSNICKKIKYF